MKSKTVAYTRYKTTNIVGSPVKIYLYVRILDTESSVIIVKLTYTKYNKIFDQYCVKRFKDMMLIKEIIALRLSTLKMLALDADTYVLNDLIKTVNNEFTNNSR